MSSPHPHVVEILLVEDNPVDADLLMLGAKRVHLSNPIRHVETGQAALDYVERRPPYASVVLPGLVLLDLNLPGLDGRDVLRAIRAHENPDVRLLPVVVLTSSHEERDIVKSYDLGANAYVIKPVGLQGFAEIVKAIDGFWFSIVKLPPRAE